MKMVNEGKTRVLHDDETSEVKKGPWKAEEDEVLINHVKKYGPRDWSSIRSKGLLRRTGKSCRLRWVNKLRPNLKNGVKFSAEEERTVIDLQAQFGNKWAKIATYLSGRTDNDVKNFWSSRQKRLARTLHTSSAPSSSKSQKNTKELKVHSFHDVPLEVPNFSSSTEEEESAAKSCLSSHITDSKTIQMTLLPELVHPSYENSLLFQFDYTLEKKPLIDPLPHLPFPLIPQMQQDFPLHLESQEFITRHEDANFLDVFDQHSAIGTPQFPMELSCFGTETCEDIVGKAESRDIVTPDVFLDDFPPIDMFDPIEPLPSPSHWSSMD